MYKLTITKKIKLWNIKTTSNTTIHLLGYPQALKWEQEGKNLVVYLPQLTFSEMPCEYAWTLKITNIQ